MLVFLIFFNFFYELLAVSIFILSFCDVLTLNYRGCRGLNSLSMAFNDMSSERGNPFGGSDNLRTPLIDQEQSGGPGKGGGQNISLNYKSAIANLTKSLRAFQQHIDKASNLSKRIGTNRDNQNIRDQIHSHIDSGRSLTSDITIQLKDFLRYVSEVSGSERVR